jgi:transcriptional regulator with XRE-family HTH domain
MILPMEVGPILRAARHGAGISQEELARRAQTSQPTIAAYEAGRSTPRLDTIERLLDACGYDLALDARPQVRRGAAAIVDVAKRIAGLLALDDQESAWRQLLDFVDDVRGSSPPGQRSLVAPVPESTGDRRFDAAIAGVVELLCAEAEVPAPEWTADPTRLVEPWWFVSRLPGFEAMALRDSPLELARHGVFVNEGAFTSV